MLVAMSSTRWQSGCSSVDLEKLSLPGQRSLRVGKGQSFRLWLAVLAKVLPDGGPLLPLLDDRCPGDFKAVGEVIEDIALRLACLRSAQRRSVSYLLSHGSLRGMPVKESYLIRGPDGRMATVVAHSVRGALKIYLGKHRQKGVVSVKVRGGDGWNDFEIY